MKEQKLAAELRDLDVTPDTKTLSLARKLFAHVLDLPGGMRIGTIHAFCQSLLRRFPLEAGLSPHFEVADDTREGLRLREAREAVLADPDQRAAIFALAAETDEQSFAEADACRFRQCRRKARSCGKNSPAATSPRCSARHWVRKMRARKRFSITAVQSWEREELSGRPRIAPDGG